MLHLYATDVYFTYICKLSCILYAASHEHISICSTYQSSAVKAWYPLSIHLNILDWFNLVYRKFDHRSSVRTLELILNNKTVYIFVSHRDDISIWFTYTCKLSCNLDYESTTHVRKIDTTFYNYIYYAYMLFFLFLPLSIYQKPRTAFQFV